jgi:ribosomal-protein-alanine N-acetyltransferase
MTDQKDEKELEIREALETDIGGLVILENACFNGYYREHRFTKAAFRYYIRNDSAICIAAIVDSYVVGYIAGDVKRSRSRLLVTMDSIAVLASLRRKGYGSRLLGALIREAKRRSCERISLFVAVSNEAGIQFFTKHGFKRLRTKSSYYSEGIDGLLMVSDIS